MKCNWCLFWRSSAAIMLHCEGRQCVYRYKHLMRVWLSDFSLIKRLLINARYVLDIKQFIVLSKLWISYLYGYCCCLILSNGTRLLVKVKFVWYLKQDRVTYKRFIAFVCMLFLFYKVIFSKKGHLSGYLTAIEDFLLLIALKFEV